MIGRVLSSRYRVSSRIARGSMATVYLASDLRLKRRVAVKVIHGDLVDAIVKRRFIEGARLATRIADSNVVRVFDHGQDADSAYLVMEYVAGITLRDLLEEYGSLGPHQTIDIASAVAKGLIAIHKAGMVHGDLKPENVLLADDGGIKIGDLGLANAASANAATGAALLGTITYLSPELVRSGVADAQSDIYAVGVMVYEMLTGERPLQIARQHASDMVPMPSAKNPKVPAELDELVAWATSRDPEQSPRDARAMLDKLDAAASPLNTAPLSTSAALQALAASTATLEAWSVADFDVFPQPRPRADVGDSTPWELGLAFSRTLRQVRASSPDIQHLQNRDGADPVVASVQVDRRLVRAASKSEPKNVFQVLLISFAMLGIATFAFASSSQVLNTTTVVVLFTLLVQIVAFLAGWIEALKGLGKRSLSREGGRQR